jgi:hypothetical protein
MLWGATTTNSGCRKSLEAVVGKKKKTGGAVRTRSTRGRGRAAVLASVLPRET